MISQDHWAPSAIWQVIEPNLAVMSACLPMLRPLYKTIFSLPTSLKDKANSSGLARNRGLERSSSFKRLHDSHQENWRPGMASEDEDLGTKSYVQGAMTPSRHHHDIPLDTIQLRDEVMWSDRA